MALEREKLQNSFNDDAQKALYMQSLSNLSQRWVNGYNVNIIYDNKSSISSSYVLEKFLNDVYVVCHKDKEILNEIKKKSENLLFEITRGDPKMSRINEVLTIESVRKLVWKKLGIDEKLRFPLFHNELLYGKYSNKLHLFPTAFVYMSNKELEVTAIFLTFLAHRNEMTLEEFSKEKAAYARLQKKS